MIDGEVALIVAILQVPAPPCEKYCCSFREKCRRERLACKAFEAYARGDGCPQPTTLPSRHRHLKITNEV